MTITGDSTAYVRIGDEGHAVRFHFCPSCGATVYYRFEDDEATTAVPVGAFADPGFPPPEVSWYGGRMHPWVGMPAGVRHG